MNDSWCARFAKRYSYFWVEEFGCQAGLRPESILDMESREVVASFRGVLNSMAEQKRTNEISDGVSSPEDDAEYQFAIRELASEAGRQLKYAWLVQARGHESVCMDDMKEFLHDFRLWMTTGRTNLYLDGTLELQLNFADFSFKAFIAPSPGTRLEECRVYLSGGILFSLDDLACRSFCNRGMLA